MQGRDATVPVGERIGRFEVLGTLGSGAMGMVVEALDPTLGRKVAIKLLLPEGGAAVDDGAARLLREAQALARLSHPNVVTIYEAGRDGEQVFLAMELVPGATARVWRDGASRSVEDVCAVYRQAAVGLSAAHGVGLVHRDVKPDNILVGDDGRVRVTDFGLVAAVGDAEMSSTLSTVSAAGAAEDGDVLATPLTRTGMVLGTPPYMAPEAHTGGVSDALGDQWSLCVAWWEALAGVRPFAGATYRELVRSICDGVIARGRDAVPEGIARVLERGLSVERAERWPSVAALVSAMDEATGDGKAETGNRQPATGNRQPEDTDGIGTGTGTGTGIGIGIGTGTGTGTGIGPGIGPGIGSGLGPGIGSRPGSGPGPGTASSPGRASRANALLAGVALAAAAAFAYRAWTSRTSQTARAPERAAIGTGSADRTAPTRHAPPTPTPTQVTATGDCPYFPVLADATTIVYDDGIGDIWKLESGGPAAVARRIVADPTNDWRVTHGRRPGEVLYTTAAAEGSSIVALDLATHAQERLQGIAFAFAFGGGALVYARTDVSEIRRKDAREDTVIARLPESYMGYAVSVTPDGRWVAITTAADRAESTVCLLELTPGTSTAVRPVECLDRDDVISGRAALAPDGSALFYQTIDGIRRRELATAVDTLWLPGAYAYGGIDVAPDGSALVYATSNPNDVVVFSPDAPDKPVLRGNIFSPDVGPDGGWYYVRHTATGDEIVEQTRDGAVRMLVSGLGRLRGSAVSPDGNQIAFEAHGREPGIWVVDTGPHPPLRLTTRNGDVNPVWTRDGKVAFTRFDDHKQPFLYVVDAALGADGDDTRTPAHRRPRMTVSRMPSTGEILVQSIDALHIYAWDPATGKERAIPLGPLEGKSVGGYPSFDGKWLVAIHDASIYKLSLGRTPVTAEKVYEQTGCNTFDHPMFDASGRLLVVERRWRGDIFTVPLR